MGDIDVDIDTGFDFDTGSLLPNELQRHSFATNAAPERTATAFIRDERHSRTNRNGIHSRRTPIPNELQRHSFATNATNGYERDRGRPSEANTIVRADGEGARGAVANRGASGVRDSRPVFN